MSDFDFAAVFLAIIAIAGWLNARFLGWPTATAMVLAGIAAGGLLLLARALLPQPNAAAGVVRLVISVDFPKAVLNYLLGLLLFAGAMQVSVVELRRRLLAIGSLATLGVLVSMVIVGLGLWLVAQRLHLPLTLPWAFVFGSLISPTDPVAVLAAVREGRLSKTLESVLQGEALFNDGFGIVVFTAAVAIASSGVHPDPVAAIGQAIMQAVGGLALGFLAASVAIRAMRTIDDYGAEVGISLALAVGVYALGQSVHVSGPIGVVVAGLMVGNHGVETAMSEPTQRYLKGFWALIDDILNAVLFLLLGLQMLVVPLDWRQTGFWLMAILLVLAARFAVVLPWGAAFRRRERLRGASLLLTWGGLHGALSLALALTLPPSPSRAIILSTTFAVVIVSVLVQGLTFADLAARFVSPDDRTDR